MTETTTFEHNGREYTLRTLRHGFRTSVAVFCSGKLASNQYSVDLDTAVAYRYQFGADPVEMLCEMAKEDAIARN